MLWFSIDTEVLYSGIVPKPKLWYGMEIPNRGTLSASGYLKWTVLGVIFSVNTLLALFILQNAIEPCISTRLECFIKLVFNTLSSHVHEAQRCTAATGRKGQPTPSRRALEKGRSLRRRRSTVRVRSVRGGVWVRGDSFSIVPAPDSPLSRGSGFPRSAQKNKRASSFLPLASQWCH